MKLENKPATPHVCMPMASGYIAGTAYEGVGKVQKACLYYFIGFGT